MKRNNFLLVTAILLSIFLSSCVELEVGYTIDFVLDDTDLQIESLGDLQLGDEIELPMISKDHYEFLGWYLLVDNEKIHLDHSIIITQSLLLYADWKPNEYIVSFYDDNDLLINKQIVEYLEDAYSPTPAVKEGYHFIGWDKTFTSVTENIDVFAQYAINSYYARFYDKDDNLIKEELVEYLESPTPPEIPQYDGFVFIGWSEIFTSITEDLEIYAIYNVGTYYVEFRNDLDQVISIQTPNHGENLVEPSPPFKEGHTFIGWSSGLENIQSDKVIYPVYLINIYTVTFVNDQSEIIIEIDVKYQEDVTEIPLIPEKNGYYSVGWDNQLTQIEKDITVYPVYYVKSFYVNFRSHLGLAFDVQLINYGHSALEPDTIPSPVGYHFIGWDRSFDNITENIDVFALYEINQYQVIFKDLEENVLLETTVSHGGIAFAPVPPIIETFEHTGWSTDIENIIDNVTIYPVYEIKTYTVTFRNYDEVIIETQEVNHGSDLTLSDIPEKIGHDFVSWDQVLTNITSDLEIYPIFTKKTYTVIFLDDQENVLEEFNVLFMDSISPIAPIEKVGHTFIGWDNDLTSISENLYVNPLYSPNIYLVNFYDNSEHVLYSQEVIFGNSPNIPIEPSLPGLIFVGWYSDFDLTNKYLFEQIPANDISIYSKWVDSSLNHPEIFGVEPNITKIVGEAFNPLYGVTSIDVEDGDLTSGIILINWDETNINHVGTYEITFYVEDSDGLTSTATMILEVVVENTFYNYIGFVDNFNPYSETLAAASDLMTLVTDSLYRGDYDWDKAINDGLATHIGDFTNTAQLPFTYLSSMASSWPQQMDTEGLVWQITLRNDLAFEDGTPINAATFDYGWRNLLDPKLLNNRASNLYSTTDLPLLNAEAYFKQLTPDTDQLGFFIYAVGGVKYERGNSYFGETAGGYDIYTVEAKYTNLIGPEGIKAYVEFWGSSYKAYGLNGWVLETQADEYFRIGTDNNLYAPTAGWTLNGVAVPHVLPEGVTYKAGGAGYAGALPAYTDVDGVLAAVDPVTGIPVGGVQTFDDATPFTWEEVGFKVIGDPAISLTFEITLYAGRTAWDIMGALTSAITGVVHPANYEAGMNAARTQTTYGTIDNPLVSYGPYNMTAWETDVLYFYTLNPNHYDAADYRITKVRYDVITDQSIAVSEFKEGRLDIVGAAGVYYNEFKFNKNLKLSPATTFFRFAFNIQGSDAYAINPILVYPEFRQAFYFAIDRETFSSEVRAPSHPTFGFLGPVYLSTEYNFVSYRASQPGLDVLADLSPDSFGYNPIEAKILFDQAYAKAILAGDIQEGEVVTVEYKFFAVETNFQVANWVKDTVETIFNDGEATPKFVLDLQGVSSAALNQAWDNGDFEMTFGGWQGLNFDAPSMLGQVYNSHFTYMLEQGFDTKDIAIEVSLPSSKLALTGWVADYETDYADYLVLKAAYDAIVTPTAQQTTDYEAAVDALAEGLEPSATQETQYEGWVAMLTNFTGNVLTTTYHGLFSYAYGELYNVKDINYDGKTDDFDAITAALEAVLLDEMIAIPLFTTVAATVYSTRVVFESNEFHAWMGWGGFKYMYLGKAVTV